MDSKEIERHFARQKHLLQMEYEYEKSEYRRISEERGVHRRVARGQCWYPVRIGRSYYNSLNRFVVELFRDGEELGHHFECGSKVSFFHEYLGGISYKNINATVSYVDGNRMVVALPGAMAVKEIDSVRMLGVELAFDDTSYRAMLHAVEEVASARDCRTAELRDVLCGKCPSSARDIPPVGFPWLNKSQEEAVNKVLACREGMVVHGPPGTGKTTTLVEAVYETLRRESQVLVCAQSNTAVDWISEKLVERGIPVLRIGNPTRVNDDMLSFTYERQFESHADYPELWSIRKLIRKLLSGKNGLSRDSRGVLAGRIRDLRRRAMELEVKIHVSLLERARVVAATLVGSDSPLLQGRRFTTLFIDEAGQALEAASWIAVRKADRVVFAGDHCQLPPTVKCMEAERKGLSRSLMELAVGSGSVAVSLLTLQYRMNERIMQFSSKWFYGGALRAAEDVKFRGILDYDSPIMWVDTSDMGFQERFVALASGRVNPEEGEFFVSELERYVMRIGLERILEEQIDFGLISPYRAQVSWIARRVRKSNVLRPLKGRISVDTIDGFQGKERDVVFISMVRSNDDRQIGFLSDLRRMNVAITRARMKLVVVGSVSTLSNVKFYRELHEYIENAGFS